MKKRFQRLLIVLGLAISGFALVSCDKPTLFEDEDLINSLYQKAEDILTSEGSDLISQYAKNILRESQRSGIFSILLLTPRL